MAKFQFENIRLLIGEQNRLVRTALRSALSRIGFRTIEDTSSFVGVHDAICEDRVDLLVCSDELEGNNTGYLIHELRHHRLGKNPFLVVITLLTEPTPDAVQRIVNSGADDLIVMPVAPEQLLTRIENLAKGRKPFVVTHDYIGPDRRGRVRVNDASAPPLLEVPNALRAKATGNYDPAQLQRLIDLAAGRLNMHKMDRYAVQITWLVDRIIAFYRGVGEQPELLSNLDRLMFVSEDLNRRMIGTPYAHASELASSLNGVAEKMRGAPATPHRVDVELLPKLAQAIGKAFNRERTTARTALEISSTVRGRADPAAPPERG